MSADWKRPITLDELYDIHRVAATRGRLKAKERATKFIKRDIAYRTRATEDYQRTLGVWYLQHFVD